MSTTSATDRKNVLNRTAKSSTTNIPPNVVCSSPTSVRTAISAARTPAIEIGIATHFRRWDRNASATRTSRIVPDRISSGRIAW